MINEGERKRIALIGGAGFIGHNLALALLEEGYQPYVIDGLQVNNLLYFYSTTNGSVNKELYKKIINQRLDILNDKNIPLIIEDAREYHQLSHTINQIQPHVIIHLAAVAHANRSNKDPFSTFDHSLRTLENALDNARNKVEHFIYFSSSMVYGNFTTGIVTEETHCEPLGIYGALKYAGEKLVISYNQVFDLPYTIIRPSALYGERCVSRRVSQIFIENAMDEKDVVVNGDGSDRLDYTYIEDLVNGVIKVIENEKSKNEIFNITYGSSRSIADLADIVKEHFPSVNVKYAEKDNLTPHRGTLSVEKAKNLIGYKPEFPIDVGIPKYIEWYSELYNK